jgi:hypothetical protein
MAEDIKGQIAALQGLRATELRKRWGEFYRAPSPKGASQDFLLRGLAYKLQADHCGGLKPSTQRRLRQMAKTLECSPDADLAPAPLAKPGTKLVREWENRKHEVTVLEIGFAYNGKVFDSLSKIAREITGTRWSGPVFFGLRQAKAKVT